MNNFVRTYWYCEAHLHPSPDMLGARWGGQDLSDLSYYFSVAGLLPYAFPAE